MVVVVFWAATLVEMVAMEGQEGRETVSVKEMPLMGLMGKLEVGLVVAQTELVAMVIVRLFVFLQAVMPDPQMPDLMEEMGLSVLTDLLDLLGLRLLAASL